MPGKTQQSARAEALSRAIDHLLSQQHPDGRWEGEMVWNTMILAQHVIVCRIVDHPIADDTRHRIVRHFAATRTPEGGWGMHPESPPYVFFTTLAYVALRLLGLSPSDSLVAPARHWLHRQPGGVSSIPTWGRFWLSLLGLYDYRDVNPVLPELFLLPRRLPVHPGRLYCHTRNIYQGMAFLYGTRFVSDIAKHLKAELFEGIPVTKQIAASDLHARPGWALRGITLLARGYERIHSRRLRATALQRCLAQIVAEQQTTGHRGLSPVNSLLNILALHADSNHRDLAAAGIAAQDYWRWDDETGGVRFAGARSASWDTAFAIDCLTAAGSPQAGEAVDRARTWLRGAQITKELPPADFRDKILGGWCFSDATDTWPVSDCTAEAVTALLHSGESLPIESAADFILARQNPDGGFATYERQRAPRWMERLNPSEMFANCMIDRSYVECTASALCAFAAMQAHRPDDHRLVPAIRKGAKYLRRNQSRDGSFAGSWGISFIYGTFFAIRGLIAAGATPDDPALRRAGSWLLAKQKPDGGWGEHYTSATTARYVEHSRSQPVMTSWALLALLSLDRATHAVPVQRGVNWLCDAQRPNGSWDQQAVNGVFFGTGMLDYKLYATYFPALALAKAGRGTGAGGS